MSESQISRPGASHQSTSIELTATTVQTPSVDGMPQLPSTNIHTVATVVKRLRRTALSAGTRSIQTTGVALA